MAVTIPVPNPAQLPRPSFTVRLEVKPERGTTANDRVDARGKFLWAGQEKLYVKGVTYGTFCPNKEGVAFPSPQTVEQDFSMMSASGINAVRTYNAPPRWLLDSAHRHGLRVLVGLQAERHYAFLHNRRMVREIRKQVKDGAQRCARHPAVLAYTLGNEIPATIVRWHGVRNVERFLKELQEDVKEKDPSALISYANYPSTEYLDLPFLDLLCFNVFLESRTSYEAYLGRLQNLAGNRPLLVTEIGLDSRRNGEAAQGACLDWQVRGAFAAGCAGAFVYSWTDEWYRGGEEVTDWDFGLTSRQRRPKAALQVVRKAFDEVPFPPETSWPKISVVVCSFNGSRTIRGCLEGIEKIRYPDYETIVIDDGSTDGTGDIAREFNVRLIRTENRGLSAARNLGWQSATGEIVAYIDDDAQPDPDWLTYLASAFLKTNYAGVGGPNIPFLDDGPTASCVAGSPGGPAHVLLSDSEAEHIPGCNMAFRRKWLEAIGGFDVQFRQAGDDVDVCWRMREHGGRLGFSPAAMIWHHYRRTVRAYWKQQVSYGRAEAMLERKWPERYNSSGQANWRGRIYMDGLFHTLSLSRGRIYQGTWGTAGFARLYQAAPNRLNSLSLMPEWQLTTLILAMLSVTSILWKPLIAAMPLTLVAFGLSLIPTINAVLHLRCCSSANSHWQRFRLRALTAALHLMQPLARLWGRLTCSLTPWRIRRFPTLSFPWPRMFQLWSEKWRDAADVLQDLESVLRSRGTIVRRGGDFDDWDLEVHGGMFGGVRIRTVSENYGPGKHMMRLYFRPSISMAGIGTILLFLIPSVGAAMDKAIYPAMILGVLGVLFLALALRSGAVAVSAIHCALIKMDFERA
jgi:GT2 family glycosyltransferase